MKNAPPRNTRIYPTMQTPKIKLINYCRNFTNQAVGALNSDFGLWKTMSIKFLQSTFT